MRLWLTLPALVGFLAVGAVSPAQHAKQPPKATAFVFQLRSRVPGPTDKDQYQVVVRKDMWYANQTAIIVCDVWDAHHCLNAVRRLDELLPVMNRVLEEARAQGVL